MFLRIEGYFHMSLTCFDRKKTKKETRPISIFAGPCLSAGVEKDVSAGVCV